MIVSSIFVLKNVNDWFSKYKNLFLFIYQIYIKLEPYKNLLYILVIET